MRGGGDSLWGEGIEASGLAPRICGELKRGGAETLGAWVGGAGGGAGGALSEEDGAWAERLRGAARRLMEAGEGARDFGAWLDACLPKRLRELARRRYALDGEGRGIALHERALSVVGREMGVGRERARQLAGDMQGILKARLPRALAEGVLAEVRHAIDAAGGAMEAGEMAEAWGGAGAGSGVWGGVSAVGGALLAARLGGMGLEEYRGFFTTADRGRIGELDGFLNREVQGTTGWVELGELAKRWAQAVGGDGAGRLLDLLARNGSGMTTTRDGRAGREGFCTRLLLRELLEERSPQGVGELTAEFNRRVHAGSQKGRGGIRAALLSDAAVVRAGADRWGLGGRGDS